MVQHTDQRGVHPMTLGRISSYYYLNHKTMRMFRDELKSECTMPELIEVLSNAEEYAQLPVRHNEDQINSQLAQKVPLEVNPHTYDSSHTKTHILLQCHFGQLPLPSTDYNTDTKSVLDQAIRILQAMLDVSADEGWLVTSLRITQLIQMVIQGRWYHDNALLTLPHMTPFHISRLNRPSGEGAKRKGFPNIQGPIQTLPEFLAVCDGKFDAVLAMLGEDMTRNQLDQLYQVMGTLPQVEVNMVVKGWWEGGEGQQEARKVSKAHTASQTALCPFPTGRGTKLDVRGPIRHQVPEDVLLDVMVAILISVKPLVVGTPKLKLIVRVEQEKGGTLVRVLAPVRIIQVLVVIPSHLPEFPRSRVEVNMVVKGWWEGGEGQQEARKVSKAHTGGRRPDSDWIQVHADQEYVIEVTLKRLNKFKKRDSKAHAPRFPKPKDEGWFLIIGDIENREVVALKRVGYLRGASRQSLAIYTPETPGRVIYTLYLMSDAYLGLDQQYDICLDIIPASIETQSKHSSPTGGQQHPISTEDDKALWKNAQKNEKNNINSEIRNKIKPKVSPD
uniref:Activating signal cointegrator 1 complex subunit 3 n=1 Tax=Magallana gigas TaxID=29159 RepID=K1RGX5_MAGGI